mmetsp:Transcript_19565/g.50171  ORF Transcript_19565/g.50171 Transcript_19565/m.50171 type:complete len:211 (+) Transcript_19565:661-1293(+)
MLGPGAAAAEEAQRRRGNSGAPSSPPQCWCSARARHTAGACLRTWQVQARPRAPAESRRPKYSPQARVLRRRRCCCERAAWVGEPHWTNPCRAPQPSSGRASAGHHSRAETPNSPTTATRWMTKTSTKTPGAPGMPSPSCKQLAPATAHGEQSSTSTHNPYGSARHSRCTRKNRRKHSPHQAGRRGRTPLGEPACALQGNRRGNHHPKEC